MFLLRFSKKSYAIIGGTILLCCVFIFHSLSTIVSSKLLDGVNKGELIFEVEKGDTLSDIIDDLQNNELISNPLILFFYGRNTSSQLLKVGDYLVTEDDSFATLLRKIRKGDVINYAITFIEGWTFEQWLDHFSSNTHFRNFDVSDVDALLDRTGFDKGDPEGWFFPDTYYYTSTSKPSDILKTAFLKMKRILKNTWNSRNFDLSLKSDYDLLILASIIEKETGFAGEQRLISAVFNNRLKLGMRLQTDPTVIYGLGESFDGNLTKRHLKHKTPYNTYRIDGLPPTPICMPSEKSILAAVNPEHNEALYFVAKGDGTHEFSNNLEDHQRAVKEYQIFNRKKEYKTSPN